MGLYSDHIMPRITHFCCSLKAATAERLKVVPLAAGIVVEVGMGSGLNLPHYDRGKVRKLIGINPPDGFARLLRPERDANGLDLEVLPESAESMSLESASADEVKKFLEDCRERVLGFFRKADLPINWENATDPFFRPTKNPKYLLQKLDPVKQEMVYGGSLAIGSVNFHRNYFGEAFRITRGGEEAFSGCVAFGLERWIYAILDRFGGDPAGWPDLEGSPS
jgi:hypothetical protein